MPAYKRSVTGVGISPVILLDTFQAAGNIGFQVTVSGTVTYTVQHSNDPEAWAPDTGLRVQPVTFFDDANLINKTVNADGNFIVPIQWVRLNVTAGTGTAVLEIRQGGPGT